MALVYRRRWWRWYLNLNLSWCIKPQNQSLWGSLWRPRRPHPHLLWKQDPPRAFQPLYTVGCSGLLWWQVYRQFLMWRKRIHQSVLKESIIKLNKMGNKLDLHFFLSSRFWREWRIRTKQCCKAEEMLNTWKYYIAENLLSSYPSNSVYFCCSENRKKEGHTYWQLLF